MHVSCCASTLHGNRCGGTERVHRHRRVSISIPGSRTSQELLTAADVHMAMSMDTAKVLGDDPCSSRSQSLQSLTHSAPQLPPLSSLIAQLSVLTCSLPFFSSPFCPISLLPENKTHRREGLPLKAGSLQPRAYY